MIKPRRINPRAAQAWGDSIERSENRSAARRTFQRAARESSAQRERGLVLAAYLAVRPDGRMVQLRLPGMQPEVAKRGECEGFSEDSRRRLMEMLHSIRRDAKLPIMVTLTFPEELVVSPAQAKACRSAFEKRIMREHPRFASVWRLEAHPEASTRLGRMHPHFHILAWGAWFDLAWLSRAWASVVWSVLELDECLQDASGRLVREKHVAAGVNCERVRKWEGVIYCAKSYIAKEEEFPVGKAGRVWGWCNRGALPLSREVLIPLSPVQALRVRGSVQRWMFERRINSDYLVRTFFNNDPEGFVEKLIGGAFRGPDGLDLEVPW